MAKTPTASTGTPAADTTFGATTGTAGTSDTTASPAKSEAKAKFANAIEEAKAGAAVLGADAKAKAEGYRADLAARSEDWVAEAKGMAGQAKERAAVLATDGKTRASDAIATLGKMVGDNAQTIDEKLGTRYGDYARSAARTMQESAAKLDSKDIAELGDDAKEFVRKSPGLAVGIAAAVGFLFARMFKGGSKN